jgi:predicted NodU family carbamoyl transferase
MKYYGLHMGHDACLVILDEHGEIYFCGQSERFQPRWKAHGNDFNPITAMFDLPMPEPDDIVVATSLNFNSGPPAPEYDDLVISKCTDDFTIPPWDVFIPTLIIDHHLAHAITAWCFRENDSEKLFMTYDGAGADCKTGKLKSSLVGTISNEGFEIHHDAIVIPSSVPVCNLTGWHSAGKVMGMAGYHNDISEIEWNEKNVITLLDHTMCEKGGAPIYPTFNKPLSKEDIKFCVGMYNWLIRRVWDAIQENMARYRGDREVVVGGGTSLALNLNTLIHNEVGSLTFAPPTNDSGLALGAAAMGYFHANKRWIRVNTPSLNSLAEPLPSIGPQEPEEIANKLVQGAIIGLLRGQSEAGPRALGFRSIFASAEKPGNLKLVSETIKKREHYRPLAPIVTERQFDKYFVGPRGKYMQYKVQCAEEAQEELPAIVHKDLSARPQVVYEHEDPWLHRLLVAYGEQTGHECMINTSLNAGGKPICHSYSDAKNDMENKPVELVSIQEPKWRG